MKKFKSLFSCTIALIMLLVFSVGCSVQEKSNVKNPETTKEATTIVDPSGKEITIPEKVDKIISLAPSITEVLVELGFGDKIALVDANSKDLSGLPEGVEYVDMMTPDVEKIIALQPDIVLASTITSTGGTDPAQQLKSAGITLAYIPTSNSIEGIYSDIMFIAKVLREKEKGQKLVDRTKEKIAKIEEIGKTIKDKKTVYFEIAAAPGIYSFGQGVFLNEMIEIIGAKNVLAKEEGWISVSEEAVVAADPDVILTNVNYIPEPVDEIKSRASWKNIKAVKNNDVYYIDNMSSSLPNHNIVKALEQMAKVVYPDKY
ncbi:MAG: ABC transporter substrate-binding protein [Clostridiales bacterium]|uniref:ABC transporter substrate-binding protein n=1 Tax=Clostridium sp. N3C TaxID=1776758 RepID=UPI00092E11C1|nr:ABC transporter substrate-binding protein [Clostridium sp. N3C]NLZ49474.1 ABC transporter substrate-binding protein [Clostridiales bacterium]SCN26206.1 Ferric-citrate-binding protein [Clostridium sp. N3C]